MILSLQTDAPSGGIHNPAGANPTGLVGTLSGGQRSRRSCASESISDRTGQRRGSR